MVDCPKGTHGLYPYPFDQNKYISCLSGLLVLEVCSAGNAFSLSQKRCDSKEDIRSSDRVQYYAEFDEWNSMDGKELLSKQGGQKVIIFKPNSQLHVLSTSQ